MSEQNEAPVEASEPTTVVTGATPVEDRIAIAAAEMEKLSPSPSLEPVDDEPAEEAEGEPEAEAQAEVEKPKPRGRRGKSASKEEPKDEAKAEGEAEAAKPRNMIKDLAAEWANARRAQKANEKRAQELAEHQARLEAEASQAREVAMLMQGHPIKAVEKLAAIAGIRPSEYLQRLQQAYIDGEEPAARGGQVDAVAQELAQLRAELQAEKRARAEQEQRALYQQQVAQVQQSETTTLVDLAKHYSSDFPALQRIPDETLQARVADAVGYYLGQGQEVGRFEVLQALNNIIEQDLRSLGLGDTLEARASGAPDVQSVKATNGTGKPTPSRNGSHRHIPSNRDAANTGSRRALTVEERLKEAEKVLWAASRK